MPNPHHARMGKTDSPTSKAAPRSRLGRGLSSLMQVNSPAVSRSIEPAVSEVAPDLGTHLMRDVDPELIDPNPHQPRKQIGPATLSELAASLKSNGIIQPLVVKAKADGRYELIAGERRLRAAKVARLPKVPVVIRQVDGYEQAQLALVENIQREDLNPLDRAEAYRALQKQLGLTVAEIAGRLGEDRSTVQHYVRLLDLSPAVQAKVRDGTLPLGHAKILAGVADEAEQLRLSDLVLKQNLSVRNLERLVKGEEPEEGSVPRRAESEAQDSRSRYLAQLADTVGRQVGSKCTVTPSGQNGYKLTLHLKNAEQFDRLMERLGVQTE